MMGAITALSLAANTIWLVDNERLSKFSHGAAGADRVGIQECKKKL
jgi:hypothetical protein